MLTRNVQVWEYKPRRKLDLSLPEVFQSKVSELVSGADGGSDTVVAGDLHLIGMDEIKAKFGDGWDGVRKSIHQFVEKILNEYTEGEDLYYRSQDDQYVFLFNRLAPEESDRKARELTNVIGRALGLGDAPSEGMIATRCQLVPVSRVDMDPTGGGAEAIAAAVSGAVEAAESARLNNFDSGKSQLRPVYWPITNVAKKIISFYRTAIVSDDPAHRPPRGDGAKALDMYALERVSADLAKRTGKDMRAYTLVPISYDPLENKQWRHDYLEMVATIDPDICKRIGLQVVNLPDIPSQTRVHQMLSEASPYVAGFTFRLPVNFAEVKRLDGLKLLGVSVDGSFLGEGRPMKKHYKELKRFSEQMRARKLGTFFEGALSVDAAIAARRAEFDYVDGAGVLQPMPLPGKVYNMG